PDSCEGRMLEDVAGAIDARSLAVPHAEHAVVLRLRIQVGELAAEDGCGAEILVDTRDEVDAELAQELRVPLDVDVEAAERRATITGHQRACIEPATSVRSMLIDRQG